MFDTKLNVPYIYPEKSRDFQLLCALLNTYINTLRGNTNKMQFQVSPADADERFLSLLCTVYSVDVENLNAKVVRSVLSAFNSARCNKGNVNGIKLLVKSLVNPLAIDASVMTLVVNNNTDFSALTPKLEEWIFNYKQVGKHYVNGKLSYAWLQEYIEEQLKTETDDAVKSQYKVLTKTLSASTISWADGPDGILKFLTSAYSDHTVWIYIRSNRISSLNLLPYESLLKYVVPAGYVVVISLNDNAPQQIIF